MHAKYAKIITLLCIFTSICLSCINAIRGNEWGLEEQYEQGLDHGDGVILHYDGKTWNHHYRGDNQSFTDIYGFADNDIFTIGDRGVILHYDGKSWTRQESHTNWRLNGIWGSSRNNIYVVGDYGTILHYNGTEWKIQPLGISDYLSNIGL